MKQITFFVFGFLISYTCSSQAPGIQWQKCYGGSQVEFGNSIIKSSDGNFVFSGTSTSTDGNTSGNYGIYDAWIMKISPNGDVLWKKNYGGSRVEWTHTLQQTSDGGYIIAGGTFSNDHDVTGFHGLVQNPDGWVIKLDQDGNLQWQKTLGGIGWDLMYSVKQTNDGGYIVAGETLSSDGDVTFNHGSQNFDAWIVKLDESGNIQWQRTYGSLNGNERALSILQIPDGGYVFLGYNSAVDGDVSDNNGNSDLWLVKIGPQGDLQWQKSYGGSSSDVAYTLKSTTDGGFILLATTASAFVGSSQNHENKDVLIIKTTSDGTLEWQHCYGGSGSENDTGNSYTDTIQQTGDGGYIFVATSSSNDFEATGNHGASDIWLVRIDSSGTILWQKMLGGSFGEALGSVIETAPGSFLICGGSPPSDGDVTMNNGQIDAWIVMLQPENLSIHEPDVATVCIYPNPASSTLQIKMPQGEVCKSYQVIDLKGTSVLQGKGNITEIDIAQLPVGSYILKINSDKNTFKSKFIKQ